MVYLCEDSYMKYLNSYYSNVDKMALNDVPSNTIYRDSVLNVTEINPFSLTIEVEIVSMFGLLV